MRYLLSLTAVLVCVVVLLGHAEAAQNRKKKNQNRDRNQKQNQRDRPSPADAPLRMAFGKKMESVNLTPAQEQQLAVLAVQFLQSNAVLQQQLASVYTAEQRALLQRAAEQAVRAGVKPENVPKRVEDARATLTFTAEQQEQMKETKAQVQALREGFQQAAGNILNKNQMSTLFPEPAKKKN